MTHITFIGAGNMASALAGGMIAQGHSASDITLCDINEEQLLSVKEQLGVNTSSDNLAAVKSADVVILAVKPQVMQQVLEPLAQAVGQSQPLVISIAAGIPLNKLSQWLGVNTAIVRCMPNTPALVQQGASGLYANSHVSEQQRQLAHQALSAAGSVEWLDSEGLIDAVTAVSGSGPAYFFLVMEAMIDAGVELGLDRATAKALTLQTARGAATMAIESDVEPGELRRRVTSPGGTTEAALNCFEQQQLRAIFKQALTAAKTRSQELANQ